MKIKEIIGETYDLNKSESEFLLKLVKLESASVKEMSEKLKKDRTTSQKILSKLCRRKLIIKRQINLNRGFMFVYFIKDKDEFWINIKNSILKEFNDKMDIVNKSM